MRSADALFQAEGDFYSHPKPVFFLEDRILTYLDTDLQRWEGATHAGPGEFVLVIYGVGDVGAGYRAANRLYAFRFVLEDAIELPRGPRPPGLFYEAVDALLRMAGESVPLSDAQRSALVIHIRGNNRYWWDNATREVKEVLSGWSEDARDRARRLLRDAVAEWDGSEQQESAMRLIGEALTVYPALANAHMQLAKMAIARGDVSEAIRQCEAELSEAQESNARDAHSYLSLIDAANGRNEASRHHAQAVMAARHAVPTQLMPEVAEKIRRAVDRERAKHASTHPSVGGISGARKWWEFWKK